MIPNSLQSLERYIVQRPLGAGTEASLWLAIEKTGGPLVALKSFAPNTQGKATGLKELGSTLALPPFHPNLALPMDYGYLPDGTVFLIYEYARGGNLREYLDERENLSVSESLLICASLLSALDCLHENQLLHCDLKPENVLLFPSGSSSPPIFKLADFGLLHSYSFLNRGGSRRLAGSPAYMAPERFRDEPMHQSDLYSLGVILYEMLAGTRPFDGSPKELAKAHLHHPPPPIPDLPQGLTAFLQNLLHKDPQQRFASAAETRLHLHRLINPSTLPLPTSPDYSPPLPRLRPLNGLWKSKKTIGRFTLPLARHQTCLLLETAGNPRLLIASPQQLVLHDARTGCHFHPIIQRDAETLQRTPEGNILHFRESLVSQWTVAKGRFQPLFQLPRKPRFLAWNSSENLLAWSDGQKLYQQSAGNLWQGPLPGTLQGLYWPQEHPSSIMLLCGPMRPRLLLYAPTELSHPIETIALPGPVFQSPETGCQPYWICQDPSAPSGMTAVLTPYHQTPVNIPLPENLLDAEATPEGLVTLHHQGKICFFDTNGKQTGLWSLPESPQHLLCSLRQRYLLTWSRNSSTANFTCYENLH
ncbi:MAG: serine/threonine protein kinase [Opitutales bacterium]|nr:serine/threonine protein kinase [Opitutales bacterium]MCH8539425.1 serine/threonine protein kinase [Opitutales bacterium]